MLNGAFWLPLTVLLTGPGAEPARTPPSSVAEPGNRRPGWLAVANTKPGRGSCARPERRVKRKKRKRRKTDPLEAALTFRPARGWRSTLGASAELGGGRFDGQGLHRAEGAFTELRARLEPAIHQKRGLRLDGDLRYEQRDTYGATFAERRLRAGLDASHPVLERTRAGVGALFRSRQRPGWPDLYQPRAGEGDAGADALGSTDRYSRRTIGGHALVLHRFRGPVRLSLRAGLRDTVYTHDPTFDPVLGPNHLTPGDKRQWFGSVAVAGRSIGKLWRYRFAARMSDTRYQYRFARDAGTGSTHAGLGGVDANPLEHLVRARLRHRSSLRARPLKTRFILTGGYTRTEDLWDGYYTSDGVDVGIGLRVRPIHRLVISGSLGLDWRWYGEDGYREGGRHPPLNYGVTRRATRRTISSRIAYSFWRRHLTAFAEAKWRARETNFPDYEPGVYPVNRAYAIDWDTSTRQIRVGLSFDVQP